MIPVRRRIREGAMALAVGLLALGCLGKSPAVRHYAMSPVSGPALARIPGLVVGLGPVSFPRYLERPQLVTRRDRTELVFEEFHRWAGGFESNVVGVLAQNLSARLGGAPVLLDPEVSPLPVGYRVAVDIQQFEGRLGGKLALRARWAVRETRGGMRAWTGNSSLLQSVAGDDVPSLVAAHDALLGRLADAIAGRIADASRSLEPGE